MKWLESSLHSLFAEGLRDRGEQHESKDDRYEEAMEQGEDALKSTEQQNKEKNARGIWKPLNRKQKLIHDAIYKN